MFSTEASLKEGRCHFIIHSTTSYSFAFVHTKNMIGVSHAKKRAVFQPIEKGRRKGPLQSGSVGSSESGQEQKSSLGSGNASGASGGLSGSAPLEGLGKGGRGCGVVGINHQNSESKQPGSHRVSYAPKGPRATGKWGDPGRLRRLVSVHHGRGWRVWLGGKCQWPFTPGLCLPIN